MLPVSDTLHTSTGPAITISRVEPGDVAAPAAGGPRADAAWIAAVVGRLASLYRVAGRPADLSGVRVHVGDADGLCRVLGCAAMTVGSDIYLRSDQLAAPAGRELWLLAHEAAHVVQQRRGPVTATAMPGTDTSDSPPGAASRVAVGPPDSPEEHEANAAADAAVAGRPFAFGPAVGQAAAEPGAGAGSVVQRFMAWEHMLLGNVPPDELAGAIADQQGRRRAAGVAVLDAQCRLLDELGRNPGSDPGQLSAEFDGVLAVRLSASGLTVTAGELSALADYFSHPDDVDGAPENFLLPALQAIRSQSYRQLYRLSGRGTPAPRAWGTLPYPDARALPELRELLNLDALGRRCQLPEWQLYSSVLTRNAAHFAPFSWYRWQALHLLARDLIAQAATAPAGQQARLRGYAQVCAGYADHFLHDSFASGHLVNKTLAMQWYAEWAHTRALPGTDRSVLAAMTAARQPRLHGPDLYQPEPDAGGARMYPAGRTDPLATTDPESLLRIEPQAARVQASGVTGQSARELAAAYDSYLKLLRSGTAQISSRIVHDWLNRRPLVVAAGPGGERYRVKGDRALLEYDAGALPAAVAAAASRRAIADLLATGTTTVGTAQVFASVPSQVEAAGRLVPLREYQDSLRELCLTNLFPRKRTEFTVVGLVSPRLGLPMPDGARQAAR